MNLHNHKRLIDKSNIMTSLLIMLLLCLCHNDLIRRSQAVAKIADHPHNRLAIVAN